MTVYELASNEKFLEHNPYWFSEGALKGFGERMDEMEILPNESVVDIMGNVYECIVLKSIQHEAPQGCPKIRYSYFNAETMERVFPANPKGD